MRQPDSNPFSGLFPPQPWDPRSPSSQALPEQLNQTQTPPVLSVIDSVQNTPAETPTASPGRPRRRGRNEGIQQKLRLLRLDEWDKDKVYDEDPPTCLRYLIEWSAMLNGKEALRDTQPNLVLKPSDYWRLSLKDEVEELVQEELGTLAPDHTMVTVSVGRSARKLVKRFKADIDWHLIEHQLVQWSDLFRSGKDLRVDITFHYVQAVQQPTVSSSRKGGKRGTATQRMRNDRANQLNAEEGSTGEASEWARVYRVMRCPDSCDLGPHCWRDPVGKKHYKLYPHHLRSLVDFVEESGKLESQADVPKDIRLQLYAEAQQRRDQSQSKGGKPPAGMTPITINNHFPDHAQLTTMSNAGGGPTTTTNTTSCVPAVEPLEIPSPLDRAVKDYGEYQKSRVEDSSYKEQVDKACDVVLSQGRDLHQIHGDQDIEFLVNAEVNVGTAMRFVTGISRWAKRRRLNTP